MRDQPLGFETLKFLGRFLYFTIPLAIIAFIGSRMTDMKTLDSIATVMGGCAALNLGFWIIAFIYWIVDPGLLRNITLFFPIIPACATGYWLSLLLMGERGTSNWILAIPAGFLIWLVIGFVFKRLGYFQLSPCGIPDNPIGRDLVGTCGTLGLLVTLILVTVVACNGIASISSETDEKASTPAATEPAE